MDQVNPEGAAAPVESETPAAAPEGAKPEAVTPETAKPVAETPAAKPESDERKGVAKRLHELTTDRNHWRDLALRATAAPQPQPAQPAANEEAMKSLKDFNYDERAFLEYAEKRAEARADKAAKAAAERWRNEQDAITRRAKFDERIEQFAKTVEDYHDVVTDRTPVSEGMADALLDSEEAGAIMYYLGNNPEEARKLYYMTPAKAGRELQKLEDRLVAERKKAAEKPVSNTPPPAPRIEGKEASTRVASISDPESDKLSDEEWFRLADKERLKKRRGE